MKKLSADQPQGVECKCHTTGRKAEPTQLTAPVGRGRCAPRTLKKSQQETPSSSIKVSRCRLYSPDPRGQWEQTFSGRKWAKQILSSQTSCRRGTRRQEGWRTPLSVRGGPSCPHRTVESRQVSPAHALSSEATGRPAFGGDTSDPQLHQGNSRGPGGTPGNSALQEPSHTVRGWHVSKLRECSCSHCV